MWSKKRHAPKWTRKRRQGRTKHTMKPFFVPFAALLLCVSSHTLAQSGAAAAPNQFEVVTSARGFLGTWSVSSADASASSLVSETPEMDLRALAPGGATELDLSLQILVPGARTEVALLLGWNGALTAYLDEAEISPQIDHAHFRRDQRLLNLPLLSGAHVLRLHLVATRRGSWTVATRVLDGAGRPGVRDAVLYVRGGGSDTALSLMERAFHVDVERDIQANLPHFSLTAGLPAGGTSTDAAFQIADSSRQLRARDGVAPELRRIDETVGLDAAAVEVRVGARTIRVPRVLPQDRPLFEAYAALRDASPVPDSARGPVEFRLAEVARMVRESESDSAWRSLFVQDARHLAQAFARSQNPFASPRGYVRMGFLSRLDDTAQPYELFVPPAYRDAGEQRWPLLITLHGHSGNAGDYFRNTFGLSRPPSQTLVAHGRHGIEPTQGPMFVVGPTGRGQSQYRYAGEEDILEVIADVSQRFRIDPNRIYITGGSMGGTGAAYMPFRHPGMFAASAALAGYHDQRVRSDTHQDSLDSIEQFLRAERSDVDWAVNAQHLPMLLIRGTMDVPLPWTTRLVDRLSELHYRYEHRQPVSRHNVWTENYADGAIFRWFAPHRLPTHPRDVRFVTARERHQDAWWVQDVTREAPDEFARVSARIERDGTLAVTTEHTSSLTLAPSDAGAALSARIDGDLVQGLSPLHLARDGTGHWQLVNEVPVRPKHMHVSGPIRDVYNEPLLFVIGTHDLSHTWINEEVAREWANPLGWTMQYPIVRDVDVTQAMIRDKTLVLVGPPASNSVLAAMSDRLPIYLTQHSVVLGSTTYSGPEVGTVFVAPNPDAPDHSLLVIAGVTPFGTWRSLFLPDLLPDYVVFNEAMAPARDTFAMGGTGAAYLATGFFDMDWNLPATRD